MDVDDNLKVNSKNNLIQELERNFIAWVTMSFVLLTAAVIIEGHKPKGKSYFLTFFTLGVVLLLIAIIDYSKERSKLKDQGVEIPRRLDSLLVITIVITVVCFVVIFQNLKSLKLRSI